MKINFFNLRISASSKPIIKPEPVAITGRLIMLVCVVSVSIRFASLARACCCSSSLSFFQVVPFLLSTKS